MCANEGSNERINDQYERSTLRENEWELNHKVNTVYEGNKYMKEKWMGGVVSVY